jgi:hypothetical protein
VKYKETVAAKCRYGGIFGKIVGDEAEVIWERSEADYQGSAEVLVILGKDADLDWGLYAVHYKWIYGSCSGCDAWESRDLTALEVMREMLNEAVFLTSKEQFQEYVKRHVEYPYYIIGDGYWDDNGDWVSTAKTMAEAAEEWLNAEDTKVRCWHR